MTRVANINLDGSPRPCGGRAPLCGRFFPGFGATILGQMGLA